jgi:hypothetical protein
MAMFEMVPLELSLVPSGAVLAVLADGSGAAAGWMFARVATVYAQRH